MNLLAIKTQKLFEVFDYDIELQTEEGLTILTGPNGYGKTTILSIVNNLYNKNFFYFSTLVFELIELLFEDDYKIIIQKNGQTRTDFDEISFVDDKDVDYKLLHKGSIIAECSFDTKYFQSQIMEDYVPIEGDLWEERYGGRIISSINLYKENETVIEKSIKSKSNTATDLLMFLNSLDVWYVKEKRLTSNYSQIVNRRSRQETRVAFTVQTFANELKYKITSKKLESLKRAQELESSFPQRLLEQEEQNVASLDEYNMRLDALQEKLAQLRKFDLSDMSIVDSKEKYKERKNQKILSVYLDDTEQKAEHFNDLLPSLNFFQQAINKKQFAFKQFYINSEDGFGFLTNKGHKLRLNALSSGEQHELVLIYELLFHAEQGTLVLIDEPEISLHVAWQQEFVKDMLEIAKMRNLRLIIATHSPQIIGEYWEFCKDLMYIQEKQ